MSLSIYKANLKKNIEEFMSEHHLTKDDVKSCYICVNQTWYQIDFEVLLNAAASANIDSYNGSYRFVIYFRNAYSIRLQNSNDCSRMELSYFTDVVIEDDIHNYLPDLDLSDIVSEDGKQYYLDQILSEAHRLTSGIPKEIHDKINDEIVSYYVGKYNLNRK